MKQSIDCNIRVDDLEFWKGKEFHLLPNSDYILIIDYPFYKHGEFKVKTNKNGMGLIQLLSHIRKAYDKQYISAETDPENGYWHAIEDLLIEGIDVDHTKKTIKLCVGS